MGKYVIQNSIACAMKKEIVLEKRKNNKTKQKATDKVKVPYKWGACEAHPLDALGRKINC